jgi:acetyl esterase/lipase
VGVPIVLLLGVLRLNDRLVDSNMLNLRPIATKTSSSSDPSLILKLGNGRTPIGDEMYEDSDTTITAYLGQGEHTNHTNLPPVATKTSSSSEPLILKLWDGWAPIGDEMYEDSDTTITVYLAQGEHTNHTNTTEASASTSAAVIICPGGGYSNLITQREGHLVARWLYAHGITAVVLEYRLPHARSLVPALDAHRAIRTVRSNAVAWQVDPSRIGIMGFSAGGHVAATVGTHFDLGNPEAVHLVDRASCRPDFVVLVYPVVTMGERAHVKSKVNLLGSNPSLEQMRSFSLETQVTAQTPPMFLAHARDDRKVSPKNSKVLFAALQGKNISSQYLELPRGGHGLNLQSGPMWHAFQRQALEWLMELHFLSSVAF